MTSDRRRVLVVDVGTTGVRAAIVGRDAKVEHVSYREVLPETPVPGFVQFDAGAMADAVLAVATEASAAVHDAVDAVGIANQRASTIVWDRDTGAPVGPGVGWQDLRTVGMCLALQAEGVRVAPNASATKASFLLDVVDPERASPDRWCVGTVDTWVAWTLSGGALHVTDATNAAVTGLLHNDASDWADHVLDAVRVPRAAMPEIVDSTGVIGAASALPGAPPIAGIAGDQQASLIGQGCVRPGLAKITFGTGGMLDVCLGRERPTFELRGDGGCFPIVGWRAGGVDTWGVEAFMLTAGQCIEWLRDDLGLLTSASESAEVAAECADSGGVWFVPSLLGMGTPAWDFGARGTLLGLTRGVGRAEVVRAVLEGVAHRGADLVEAAEADGGVAIASLRVDGGMTANSVFVQALADASDRPVEVSPVLEATTLGAAFLAGLAVGVWSDFDEVAATWQPRQVVSPSAGGHGSGRSSSSASDRARWRAARDAAVGWLPELSALSF